MAIIAPCLDFTRDRKLLIVGVVNFVRNRSGYAG